jgi:hypothetical protein
MWEDPIVSEVRRIREELSARFDFDVEAIFADLRKKQAKFGTRLVRRESKARDGHETAQSRDSVIPPTGR